MDTNGSGSTNGNGTTKRPPPLPDGARMHVTRFATPFVESTLKDAGRHISKAALRSALFQTVGYVAPEVFAMGYAAALADLRANTIPVRATRDTEVWAALEGEEAEDVLRGFGLLPKDH